MDVASLTLGNATMKMIVETERTNRIVITQNVLTESLLVAITAASLNLKFAMASMTAKTTRRRTKPESCAKTEMSPAPLTCCLARRPRFAWNLIGFATVTTIAATTLTKMNCTAVRERVHPTLSGAQITGACRLPGTATATRTARAEKTSRRSVKLRIGRASETCSLATMETAYRTLTSAMATTIAWTTQTNLRLRIATLEPVIPRRNSNARPTKSTAAPCAFPESGCVTAIPTALTAPTKTPT